YSLILMVGVVGVNYLGKPNGHPALGWLCAPFAGAFVAAYCLCLNWIQTERARDWFLGHPGFVRSIRALHFLPGPLVWLRDLALRKQKDVVHIALPSSPPGGPPQKPWREMTPAKMNPGDRSLY